MNAKRKNGNRLMNLLMNAKRKNGNRLMNLLMNLLMNAKRKNGNRLIFPVSLVELQNRKEQKHSLPQVRHLNL